PCALGIAARNRPYPHGVDVFSTVVRQGTPIPTAGRGRVGASRRTFYTYAPYQTEMTLQVLQYRGPRIFPGWDAGATFADDPDDIPPGECETLGTWTLSGLRRQERTAVDVTFQIDANGVLHLIAQEQ